jgi:uncharacterized protein YdiU (UPF0061 family)
MKSKLGLFSEEDNDLDFVQNLEECLQLAETDMTIFFRLLSNFTDEKSGLEIIKKAIYNFEDVSDEVIDKWDFWFLHYKTRLQFEFTTDFERKKKMNKVNPKYVLRNYMAQLAIDAADKGDFNLIDELYKLLKKPYKEQPKHEKWFAKRPEWARHKVGCSMLSCSS